METPPDPAIAVSATREGEGGLHPTARAMGGCITAPSAAAFALGRASFTSRAGPPT
jgi:hypothetical protein